MNNDKIRIYEQQYELQLVKRTAPALPGTHKRSILGCVNLFHGMLNS